MTRTCSVLVSLAALLAATTSPADDAQQAESKAAARSLGIEGVRLADAGKCDEAVEKLERAEALYHAPTILGRLGECQINLGRVVLGTENLNRVVREQLPDNAPRAFKDAQDRAQKVLASAVTKIAHLTIKVVPPDVKAQVSFDGSPMPDALVGVERPTDPGAHEISAAAPGYLPAKASVTLAAGGHQEVTLKVEKDPNAVAPPTQTPVTPAAASGPTANAAVTTSAPGKHSNTLAYVAFGAGGVALAVGSVAGLIALSKAGDCKDKVCSKQSTLDSAKSMATVSTVGFGVGLACVALGTIALVTSSSKGEQPAALAGTRHAASRGWSVQPWLSANAAGLTGTFE